MRSCVPVTFGLRAVNVTFSWGDRFVTRTVKPGHGDTPAGATTTWMVRPAREGTRHRGTSRDTGKW